MDIRVAVTPQHYNQVIMRCIERLVKDHITSTLPVTLAPLQFAYYPNMSTDDAIAITLHTALSHLDKRNTYVRMLLVGCSSTFNTIVPSKLIIKLGALGLNPALYNWVLDFLTGRPQVGKVGNNSPTSLGPHKDACSSLRGHARLQLNHQVCR